MRLVGIALFLTHLAKYGKPISALKKSYPAYFISKNKIDAYNRVWILMGYYQKCKSNTSISPYSTIDGLKIEFDKAWVHLRRSNTEPIIRIYAEAESDTIANSLTQKIINELNNLISSPVL
jgi:phosphomannomutase